MKWLVFPLSTVCMLLVAGCGFWSVRTQIAGAIIAPGIIEVENNRQVVQHAQTAQYARVGPVGKGGGAKAAARSGPRRPDAAYVPEPGSNTIAPRSR